MSAEPSVINEATLRIRDSDLIAPVLGRVVGMLAARAQCPIDRLDDAMLLTDAVAAHAPDHADGDWTSVHVATDEEGLVLRVGPLASGGADGLFSAAALPGVGNVFERVADEVKPQREGEEALLIRLEFGR